MQLNQTVISNRSDIETLYIDADTLITKTKVIFYSFIWLCSKNVLTWTQKLYSLNYFPFFDRSFTLIFKLHKSRVQIAAFKATTTTRIRNQSMLVCLFKQLTYIYFCSMYRFNLKIKIVVWKENHPSKLQYNSNVFVFGSQLWYFSTNRSFKQLTGATLLIIFLAGWLGNWLVNLLTLAAAAASNIDTCAWIMHRKWASFFLLLPRQWWPSVLFKVGTKGGGGGEKPEAAAGGNQTLVFCAGNWSTHVVCWSDGGRWGRVEEAGEPRGRSTLASLC